MTEDPRDRLVREAHRRLPPEITDSYLDLLTEKGLTERDPDRVVPTLKFADIMAKAGESLVEWHGSIRQDDDPRDIVSLEMARLILRLNPRSIIEGSHAEEMGRLANVILRLLRFMFKDPEEMRRTLNHDATIREGADRLEF